MPERLHTHIVWRNQCAVLALRGPLTVKTVGALRRIAFEVEEKAAGPIVLDLSEVDDVDGYGLATLIGVWSRRERGKRKLALCGINPDLRASFEATFCDTLFPLRLTLAAALEAVGVEPE